MKSYHLSPEAQKDIDEIWDYIAQDDPCAATRFTAMLSEKFYLLAQQPRLGRKCDELRPDLYRFPVGSYVIFYRPRSDALEIVRLFHGARNIDALFHPDEMP